MEIPELFHFRFFFWNELEIKTLYNKINNFLSQTGTTVVVALSARLST